MPRKILNCFGIDTGIQQIRDVGVPELMGCYIEINAVNDVGVVFLVSSQCRIDHALDLLSVDVFVISSFAFPVNNLKYKLKFMDAKIIKKIKIHSIPTEL